MALQLRRGTDAERLQFTPLAGELIYTTDTKEVYIGDGSTVGGKAVTAFTESDAAAVVSSIFDATISISQPLVAGQVLKYDGISWFNSDDNSGILSVMDDLTPRLGGNLDLNNFSIYGNGNIDVTGRVTIKDSGLNIQCNTSSLPFEEVRVVSDVNGNSAPAFQIACRGSLETPSAVQPNDTILSWAWLAHDGADVISSGAMIVLADTVNSNDIASKIYIVTTPNNNTTLDRGIAITKNGVGINTGSIDPVATLDINGFAKLSVLTAAPASPTNGMVAIADGVLWDPAGTGKSVMVVYLGNNWCVAASAV